MTPLDWDTMLVKGKRWHLVLTSEDLTPELVDFEGDLAATAIAIPKGRVIFFDAGVGARALRIAWFHEVFHAIANECKAWPAESLIRRTDETAFALFSRYGLRPPPFPPGFKALARHAVVVRRRRVREEGRDE